MVTVDIIVPLPAGITEGADRVQVEPSCCPEQERLTAELKPFRLVTLTVKVAVCPAVMVWVAGVADNLKSGVAGGVAGLGVIATNTPVDSAAPPAVRYMAAGSPVLPVASKNMSHKPGLVSTAPLASFIWSTKAPAGKV